MKTLTCIVIAVLTFVVLSEAADEIDKKGYSYVVQRRIQQILNRVPEEEQKEFLRYHIHKGHELIQKKQSEKYPNFQFNISEDDSILLYNYYAANNLVQNSEVVRMAETVICWNGRCIDFSDPGVHPKK